MNRNLLVASSAIVLLASATQPALAQVPSNPEQPWGTWFIGTLQLPGSAESRWGGFAEAQARTNALFRQYFYNELKGGVSFDLDKNFTVLLGGGRYATSDYRDRPAGPLNVEKRMWGQVVLTQYSSRLKIEHRYRAEQRWFRFRDDSTSSRQRLRYRLNAFYPLNKKTIGAGTVFLSAYDEIFLNPEGPVLERNRIYLGAGYQFNDHLTLQTGWVNQANYNQPAVRQGQFIPQNTSAKRNIVIALVYRLSRKSNSAAPERLPSQQD
ncbi:DUF2490 domain-containing protein [Hymenobacter volaticus]|uniref:DUF2490 domain-containing protein n=1 Tax=Hymenobacter volaticus TaxID=2932254 RepID=A0ABY4G1F8_9BACT|nr:DUF2490 domain-containing protein [Hymenobacter volaticus]UOQ64695.1 DUF2490 domain-containing protein [Hymenobacter volaticus]